MMKTRLLFSCLALIGGLSGFASPLQAQETEYWNTPPREPDMTPAGCGTWLAIQNDAHKRSIATMEATGYLALIVVYADKTNTTEIGSEDEPIQTFLDAFCQKHPGESVRLGIASLALQMANKQEIN